MREEQKNPSLRLIDVEVVIHITGSAVERAASTWCSMCKRDSFG